MSAHSLPESLLCLRLQRLGVKSRQHGSEARVEVSILMQRDDGRGLVLGMKYHWHNGPHGLASQFLHLYQDMLAEFFSIMELELVHVAMPELPRPPRPQSLKCISQQSLDVNLLCPIWIS